MPDEVSTVDTTTVTETVTDVAAQVDTAQQPVVTDQTDSDEFKLTRKEWLDLRRELRSIKSAPVPTTTEQPKQKTAPPPKEATTADADLLAQVAQLRRENALQRAFADYGVKPGKMREFFESHASRYAPEEIGQFVASLAAAVPTPPPAPATTQPAATVAAKPTTPAPAPPAKSATDTGPPGAPQTMPITSDLSKMDREVFKSLPYEERMKRYEETVNKGRRGSSPLLPSGYDPVKRALSRRQG